LVLTILLKEETDVAVPSERDETIAVFCVLNVDVVKDNDETDDESERDAL